MNLNRRHLIASSVALAATVIPGMAFAKEDTNVLRTYILPLPFVESNRMYREALMTRTGPVFTGRDLGRAYSPLPRTSQIMTVVDEALADLKGQVFTVQLSLLNIDGNLIGQATEPFKAFRKNGEAIGWFGAGDSLKAAGLRVYGDRRLDDIGYVKVECLTSTLV